MYAAFYHARQGGKAGFYTLPLPNSDIVASRTGSPTSPQGERATSRNSLAPLRSGAKKNKKKDRKDRKGRKDRKNRKETKEKKGRRT